MTGKSEPAVLPENMSAKFAEWRLLGQRLRAARTAVRFTQQDIADASGLPRTAISERERGGRKVYALELRAFAVAP